MLRKNCVKVTIIQEVHFVGKGRICCHMILALANDRQLKELRNFGVLIETGHTHPHAIDLKISMLLLETLRLGLLESVQCNVLCLIYLCEPQEGH